jgi:4a-hydroxytetrahydrobiopterin dehydratase
MAPLSPSEVDAALAALPGWRREGDTLVADRELDGFTAAIAFVDRVAEAAEAAGHHPDILVHGYRHVRLVLTTHSEGGITDADLSLARALDGALNPGAGGATVRSSP